MDYGNLHGFITIINKCKRNKEAPRQIFVHLGKNSLRFEIFEKHFEFT